MARSRFKSWMITWVFVSNRPNLSCLICPLKPLCLFVLVNSSTDPDQGVVYGALPVG